MPLGRNQGGGAGRRPAPGDIRPKGIRTRRPLSFGVRCFLVWEKTFLLRGGVPASRVGPAAAIPGKLARFVPTFLTDAAETPRKNLRLDRHGDPWVAVHPVRLLRHGAVPVPAEPYVLGQGRGTAEVVAVRAVVVACDDAVAARGDRP